MATQQEQRITGVEKSVRAATTKKEAANGKLPLTYEELRDIIDLALWAGQLLLQHGAETDRIEEIVHRLGTGLGCDWMDILVSPNAIVVTTVSGAEFRTKIRRVVNLGVNFGIVAEVTNLCRRVSAGELDRAAVRTELERISTMPCFYNRWLAVLMVGLSCAAFSRLFGGDWYVFGVTFVAAATAMSVRQELTHRHFNGLLIVVGTAFVATLLASSATFLRLSSQPQLALIASVLLLVPGVHLINAVEDLLKGHLVTGLVRGMLGVLVTLGIALGLVLAMNLVGITGL
jgi:uncharacterized membrane protein YjjP (DUF1212 family)